MIVNLNNESEANNIANRSLPNEKVVIYKKVREAKPQEQACKLSVLPLEVLPEEHNTEHPNIK